MFFKVKAGRHVDGNGTTYHAGDVVESDLNLLEEYPNKFERAIDRELAAANAANPTVAPPVVPEKPQAAKAKKTKVTNVKPAKAGKTEDVTKTIPDAKKNGFKVLKDNRGYWVINTDDGNTKPDNETPLTVDQVVPFMDTFFDESETKD